MRRWLQFSMRALLVVMTVFAIWLGWLTESVRRQRTAIESLTKLPNIHFYRGERAIDDLGFLSDVEAPAVTGIRSWVADRVGVDYVADVTIVGLSLRKGSPDFERLSRLPLEYLSLEGGQLDRRAVDSLKRMKTLRWLVFYGDAGLSDRDVSDLRRALPTCQVKVFPQPWAVAGQRDLRTCVPLAKRIATLNALRNPIWRGWRGDFHGTISAGCASQSQGM